ncbi:MAG: nodulation protein NodJ [Betaproteobacteria bacterium HGW-Betaproteobacteria-13]|jgi:lipooligosaccharide transport system permease protein|uniref:Transport permease protein n=1 Tax=Parazoarcus communis TaxID=41977 RepID=A0A2U8H2D1_9RHOO|nr:ABC transporter permease [Parazoarcus communis]AWI79336.1 nodulation protein NodJ [Parazoarcus communis]PKO59294.1 MAG: nodulation protein NodJ [Betaproteobacteria bacterium HGW-Betaproteobacteria-19]PKO79343.1 MAG: nodulation protein NodJ [Betaproteobacteria bacterium HGW-Betaproteobacteria-13]
MTPNHWRLPQLSLRFVPVWQRNFLVWRKLALPSVLGNLADPVIYLFGLGFGIGMLVPEVGGVSYISFLAAGMVCYSTMNSATFEVLYSSFSRMHVQRTWDAILNAPVSLDDVVFAELMWAASKALLSGAAILLVISLFGLVDTRYVLWLLPLIFLVGLTFGALGLIVTALAPSYDFFMYYFTLFITPMMLVSGVFFPADQLPPIIRAATTLLPLSHAIELARPLLLGRMPEQTILHLLVLMGYCSVAFWLALSLTRRRLLK